MSEDNNPDHIYILRTNADEYIIGNDQFPEHEIHTMNLNDALMTNLKNSWAPEQEPNLIGLAPRT